MQEVDWQGILGGPIRVQVSISLRNILEIDELRQVAKNDEIANFLSNVFFQMSAINLGCNTVPILQFFEYFFQKHNWFLNSEFYCYIINSQT